MVGYNDAGPFLNQLLLVDNLQVEERIEETACGASYDVVEQGAVHVFFEMLAVFKLFPDICGNECHNLVDAHI